MIRANTNRNLVFHGNSIMATQATRTQNSQYWTTRCYNNLLSSGVTNINHFNFAKTAKDTGFLNTQLSSIIVGSLVSDKTYLIFHEITNDYVLIGSTATQCYNNVVTYCNTAVSLGIPKKNILVGTMLARNFAGDPAGLEADRLTINTNIRDNFSTFCGAVLDFATLPYFDAIGDASNTTYYDADKLHLSATGDNEIEAVVTAQLRTML